MHETLLNVSGGRRLRSHSAKFRAQAVSHIIMCTFPKLPR